MLYWLCKEEIAVMKVESLFDLIEILGVSASNDQKYAPSAYPSCKGKSS